MNKTLCALALTLCVAAQSAFASYDLQVTEMWPGNEPGSNLTSDWFELTNLGTSTFTFGVDADVYFDDESADETVADQLFGITTIDPGESVIFVDGGASLPNPAVAQWELVVWTTLGTLPQVGTYNGSGLGQGGDAVALFLDTNFNGPEASELLLVESYPSMDGTGGRSFDSNLGAISAGPLMTKSATSNDINQFAIGSPGYLPTSVPEPTALGLAGLGLAALARRRR